MKVIGFELEVRDNNEEVYGLELTNVRFSNMDLKEIDEDNQEVYGFVGFVEDGSWLTDDSENIITSLEIESAKVTFQNENGVDFEVYVDGEIEIMGDMIGITLGN